jgi:hypothetical protein
MIKRVKYWCLFFIIFAPCYESSDEKGIESATAETEQDRTPSDKLNG